MADPVITVLETRSVPLKDLSPYPANPRNGDIDLIRESIRAHGQYRAMVVNRRSMQVLAGNHLLHAMLAEGFTEGLCHFVDVDDEEAARIVLVDNRASDLGKYDDGLLAQLLESLPDLSGTGYDDRALQDLLGSLGPKEGLTDPDEVPELPEEAVTKPGDLWILGEHRLLCGDATKAEDYERLMGSERPGTVWTDPPYGIQVQAKDGTIGGGHLGGGARKYRPLRGDDGPETAKAAYGVLATLGAEQMVLWGANNYASVLPDASCWLVWDKRTGGHFADCELAWTSRPGAARLFTHQWSGMIRASERGPRVHPTQKPVALAAWGLDVIHATGPILDPFAGSGSTLIAAHQLGRVAYLMEIDPLYCDVICRRFQEFSGIVPKRESGEAASFIPELE